ncbi:MAG TPA: amino acid adenylation domain-containing protein, partial [Pyrinomonadaceae bacterium]|nr:amino acid adenylation domain-containing protein [Pyrinomonadaceae bacterium]
LDSMISLHLLHRIEIGCGVTLPVIDLLDECSVSELELKVKAQLENGRIAELVQPGSSSHPINEYPLSKGQQALWFLYQVAPASATYNIASAAKIDARLNVEALRQAFQMLVAEHPVLRTTFTTVDGQPVQRVNERMEIAFQEQNAEEWSDETLQACLSEEAERPFDLERGPLVRVNLFHKSEDRHVLMLTLHHIITDFWSLALLARELGTRYSSLVANDSPAIARPAMQFSDYVLAEERFLNSSAAESQLSYWEQRLQDAPNVLNLPADHPRPPARTYRGASQLFSLNADLTRRLKALSRSCDTTLYTTLLSAFNVLLHRYTSQDDLVVGSPNAGRNRAETSAVQGYFVNTLVMRNDLSGDPTFTNLLDRVRTNVLSAFAHQDIPFSMLVEKLQPQRDASMSPLFNVMFVLQKSPMQDEHDLTVFGLGEGGARISTGGLTLESIRLERQVSHFDLTLMLTEAGDELKGTLKYSTDLFAADRIQRMAAHLTTILEEIARYPSQRISQLAMLPQDERRQLLIDWNSTTSDFPANDCLAHVFEEQARRVPGREAVIFNEDVLTYDQLNRRANQLAHHLRSLGVGPEARVGLFLERSVDVIVGLLAILKAGAAYVPLDPAAPQDRLAYVLSDADVRVLLTMRHLSERVPAREMHVISLDTDRDLIALERDENLSVRVHPESLAYIIYTSGSTGRPKGVMIQHRSVLNLAQALQKSIYESSMDGAQRIGLNAPLTFDASVKQIIMLLHGHTLCLLPEDKRSNGTAFLSYVAEHKLNAFDCTPSHLELLLATGLTERAVSQQMCLLIGGEPVNEHLWKTLQSAAVTAYNVYGPTECTVDATVFEIGTHPEASVIGTPLPNVQVYLLDSEMQPVPIGVPGEIHIGGAGLARGYLNHPSFTALKFIPNPFSSSAGDRLYKTGDMACFLADGKIKFLGRTDRQVKVRGYRIELGEIEEVLHECPAVREAVVLAREDQSGDKRLVAYVVGATQESPSQEELRGFLKNKLPDYMVPQTYVVLEALPLTNRGKVDRSALPVPELSTLATDGLSFAPRTAVEEVLADLFAELLHVEAVGIYDNFFELGGHSLLATRLVSQIQEIFATDLPLLTYFFGDPTVAGLVSALIESKGIEDLERTAQIMKSLDELTDEEVEAMLLARETGGAAVSSAA